MNLIDTGLAALEAYLDWYTTYITIPVLSTTAVILLLVWLPNGGTRVLAAWWREPVGVTVTAFALAIMLLAPQMRDMFVGMTLGDDGGRADDAWWHPLGLGMAATCLGLSAWYWTRAGLQGRMAVSDGQWLATPVGDPLIRADGTEVKVDAGTVWAPRAALIVAGIAGFAPVWLERDTSLQRPLATFAAPLAGFVALWLSGLWFKRHHFKANQPMRALLVLLLLFVLSFIAAAVVAEIFTLSMLDQLISTTMLGFELMVAVFLLVTYRRHFIGGDWLRRRAPADGSPLWDWRLPALFAAAPFSWIGAAAGVLLAVLGMWTLAFHPAWWECVHPPSAALLAMALLIPIMSVTLAVLRDAWACVLIAAGVVWSRVKVSRSDPSEPTERPRRRVELVSSTLGVLLILGLSPLWDAILTFDGHYVVRCLPDPKDAAACAPLPGRPTLDKAVEDWRAARPWLAARAEKPAIIVAVEGGASRSAAWLLPVLRQLDAASDGQFGRHMFAITAVSGGALGAATYAQALARLPAPAPPAPPTPSAPPAPAIPPPGFWSSVWDRPETRDGMVALARADLLSPTIATFFLNDAVGRSVLAPFGWHGWDRGAVLEQTFERHWQAPHGLALTQAQAERGLVALTLDRPGVVPYLLMNGTEVRTGRRIIASSIRFDRDEDRDLFSNADDFLAQFGHDIPLSTAVTHAARFPFISPPGRFLVGGERDADKRRQIVDGGVFENYGARTAWELARALASRGLTPIVVVVSDDIEAAADDHARRALPDAEQKGMRLLEESVIACAPPRAPSPEELTRQAAIKSKSVILPEGLVALLGLNATRGAHGADELVTIRRMFCGGDGDPAPSAHAKSRRFFHIDMPIPVPAFGQSAPLNWVLDERACRFVLGDALAAKFNQDQMASLAATLTALGAVPTQDEAKKLVPASTAPPDPKLAEACAPWRDGDDRGRVAGTTVPQVTASQ